MKTTVDHRSSSSLAGVLRFNALGGLQWFAWVCASSLLGLGAPSPPTGVIAYSGDRSVILHWDRATTTDITGHHVYGAGSSNGPWRRLTSQPLTSPAFAHFDVTNGVPSCYAVRAVDTSQQESSNSAVVSAAPQPFGSDAEFLEYVQRACFDYFWYEANPVNGLIRDRSQRTSPCSIAAVGFGLTAIGIGIDHGWITREQGRARVRTTLRTFWERPQGANASGVIGHRGWFYHFLDLNTAARVWSCELSSIDTALFLAGVREARQYFDGAEPDEAAIRELADALLDRVDWLWMANGQNSLAMGWKPESGFLTSRWIGYNEAMVLYLFGLGAATNPLPAVHWQSWVNGYRWRTNYGQAYVEFPPLFGHQYSHCWVDFRHRSDAYMSHRRITYFENSRRATLAQRAYAIANPRHFRGYSSNVWGLTACDGPGVGSYQGYSARGAPPPENDDGTIAPTAPGGSMPFAPEVCLPALRELYASFRTNLWTGYGFRDAFNLAAGWWDPDVLGIDQGPILLMIENYRTGRVWQRFMRNPEIQRGLERAGFTKVTFVKPRLSVAPGNGERALDWSATAAKAYQVEYSGDLETWRASPTGYLLASNTNLGWLDAGPPATETVPGAVSQRFYRAFELGPP